MALNPSAQPIELPANPCCLLWKIKHDKVKEGRRMVRNACTLLENRINVLEDEQEKIKKACKDEQNRANVLEVEKEKEVSLRTKLETEVTALKSENCSVKFEITGKSEELKKETELLRESISEKEGEIERLKQLLVEEKPVSGRGKKVPPSEKKKITELQKNVQYEKNRADEACERVDAAERKYEEDRVQVEMLNNQVKNISQNLEEANRMLEAEKKRVIVEQKKADKEKKRAKKVEEKLKSLENEKLDLQKACKDQQSRADSLESEREKEASLKVALADEVAALKSENFSVKPNVELEKEIALLQELVSEKGVEIESLKQLLSEEKSLSGNGKKVSTSDKKKTAEMQKNLLFEKTRADDACKIVEEAKRKLEEDNLLVETLKNEVNTISQKLEETNKMFEAEKESVIAERKKAEEEKARANELRSIVEANEKTVADERCHTIKLSTMLEEEKQKADKLQKELQEVTLHQKSAVSSQLDELSKNLEVEKEKVVTEKKRADLEMSEKEELKKAVESNMEKAREEKHRADNLCQDLQSCELRIENLQQELSKVNCMLEAERLVSVKEKQHSDALNLKLKEQIIALEVEKKQLDKLGEELEVEKKRVAFEETRVNLEMSAKEEQKKVNEAYIKKAMEDKLCVDKLSQDLQYNSQKIESLEEELNKVNCMLETERLLLAKERNSVDALKSKLEEQARIAIENEKIAMEEKARGDNMIYELENVRQKLKDVENQLCEVKQSRDLAPSRDLMEEHIKLLQGKIVLQQEQVEFYQEVVKMEKDRNIASEEELQEVKHDFQCLLQQMDRLSETFSPRINKKRRLNARSLELPERMPSSSPTQLGFCCDADHRLSSSSKDTFCHLKSNTRLVDAEQPVESPSVSFSDDQLLGSQEREVDSLATQARLAAKDPDRQAAITRVNESDRVATVELDVGHVKKRRKIADETVSASKTINLTAETNQPGLHYVSAQPIVELTEKVNLHVTSNNDTHYSCGNFDLSGEKMNATHEPQVSLQQVEGSTVQIETDKLTYSAQMTTSRMENSQPAQAVRSDMLASNRDVLLSFEQELNGDYMKLLDLDDPVAEEHFRMALEYPISPALPDIPPHWFSEEIELRNFDIPVFSTMNASVKTGENDKIPSFCIVFSDMGENINCRWKIFSATKSCVTHLRSSLLQPHWLMKDILQALFLEQDLIPREKVCVFFSLMILNFVWASSTKSTSFQYQELTDTFSADLQSVLLNVETRHLVARICDLGDLLGLCEDFLLNKKIMSRSSMTSDPLNSDDSSIEILHEDEDSALRPNLASSNMVIAGSILLASISVAAGLVDSLCEVSLKIIRMIKTDCSMTLLILHTFAYVCGEEYCTNINYNSIMEAIKYIVQSAECSSAINGDIQPVSGPWHQLFPGDRCPFTGSSIYIDDISSKIIEEVHRCTNLHNQTDPFVSRRWVSLLSTLETLAENMSWNWVCDNIISKLFKILESGVPESNLLTAVVALLADLGRLRVEAGGYNDPGVKNIIQQLSANLHRATSSKCITLSLATVHALIQLQPNGHEALWKNNEDPSVKGHEALRKNNEDPSVKGARSDCGIAASTATLFSSLTADQTSEVMANIRPILKNLPNFMISDIIV